MSAVTGPAIRGRRRIRSSGVTVLPPAHFVPAFPYGNNLALHMLHNPRPDPDSVHLTIINAMGAMDTGKSALCRMLGLLCLVTAPEVYTPESTQFLISDSLEALFAEMIVSDEVRHYILILDDAATHTTGRLSMSNVEITGRVMALRHELEDRQRAAGIRVHGTIVLLANTQVRTAVDKVLRSTSVWTLWTVLPNDLGEQGEITRCFRNNPAALRYFERVSLRTDFHDLSANSEAIVITRNRRLILAIDLRKWYDQDLSKVDAYRRVYAPKEREDRDPFAQLRELVVRILEVAGPDLSSDDLETLLLVGTPEFPQPVAPNLQKKEISIVKKSYKSWRGAQRKPSEQLSFLCDAWAAGALPTDEMMPLKKFFSCLEAYQPDVRRFFGGPNRLATFVKRNMGALYRLTGVHWHYSSLQSGRRWIISPSGEINEARASARRRKREQAHEEAVADLALQKESQRIKVRTAKMVDQ